MNRALTGIDGQVDEDLARRLSPCLQVSESTPPMFLWTTSEDQLVDPCQTLKMAMALSQHHVPYELHVFEHGPHGMVLGSYATAAGETHLDHRIAEWIIMADKWMRQRMIPAFSEDAACL